MSRRRPAIPAVAFDYLQGLASRLRGSTAKARENAAKSIPAHLGHEAYVAGWLEGTVNDADGEIEAVLATYPKAKTP